MAATGVEPLGKDVFLRLLTTQLKHQDPLEPMDGTEFVTQLAQFTQLEQTTSMNERLQELVEGNTALNHYGVTGLIGKEVKVAGGAVSLAEGGSSELSYRLEGDANDVTIQVSDAAGGIVRSLTAGQQGSGMQSLHWDGRDQNGNALPAGTYQFEISARDADGGPVLSQQYSQGIVSRVRYEEGVSYLMVNGEKVPAANVLSVK
ncbi:MAG: flagellar hook assembly protein FlgD [Nitrospiria bacterium]